MTENMTTARQQERSDQFEQASKWIGMFGVWNAVVLAVVAAGAAAGGATSTFMWVRGAILVAVAPFLGALARRAGRADGESLRRLRFVATILPVAVIVVDFVPGVAPAWYAILQSVGALALVPVAVVARRWTRVAVGA